MGNCSCINGRHIVPLENTNIPTIQNQTKLQTQKDLRGSKSVDYSTPLKEIKMNANSDQPKLEQQIDDSFLLRINNEIIEYFPIHKIIASKLNCLCFTSDNLTSIAETVQSYLKNVSSQRQQQQQINQINQFLGIANDTQTEEVKLRLSKILNDELFFSQLAQAFRQKLGRNPKLSTLSRLFHQTANVKHKMASIFTEKQKKILETQWESQIDSSISSYDGFANFQTHSQTRFVNKYGIYGDKYGDYKAHKKEQVKVLVQAETASELTEKFGEKISFKLQIIKTESEGFVSMLNAIFGKYSSTLSNLSYDLSCEESLTVAKIAREACEYYDNGVFFLLFYLSKAIRTQSIVMSIKDIEEMVNEAIKAVSYKYPPGQTLDGIDNSVKQLLSSHQIKKESTKGFKHHPSPLDQSENKLERFVKIILGYAVLANSSLSDFEDLIINTCISRSVMVKAGLKLNPDKPNAKSLLRIQEKMLFKEAAYFPPFCSSLNEVYETEESCYFAFLKQLLEQKQQVKFEISDMVRGKCTYATMKDIIDTIAEIKQFAAKYPKKYRIIEVESRFNNLIPISDVTLKIVINEDIVAELQLTLQTNVAAYKMSHKVYEVNRCKIFSKIKKIDNDFKEMFGEVTEMTLRALQIVEDSKPIVDPEFHGRIKDFIIRTEQNKMSFDETVCRTLTKSQSEFPHEFRSKNYQFLTSQTLKLALCSSKKVEIGEVISETLSNSELSEQMKAVFLYSFVKNINFMDFGYTIKSGMNMGQWLLNQFSIRLKDGKQIERYFRNNARIHYYLGCFQKILLEHRHNKDRTWIFQSMFGQSDPLLIPLLNQIANIIYLIDFNRFQPYSKWLLELLQGLQQSHELKPLCVQSLYLRSKWLIIKNQIQPAQSEYLKAKKYAQSYEKYDIIATCDLDLLYIDLIFKKDIDQTFLSLQKLQIFCRMNFIKMQGKFYVERMANILTNLLLLTDSKNLKLQRNISEYVYKRIIDELHSLINTWKIIYPLFYFYEKYHDQFNLQKPQWPKQLTCHNFTQIYFYQSQTVDSYLSYITQFSWKDVANVNLNKNSLTKKQIEIILKSFVNLKSINLDQCNLGNQGCEGLLTGNESPRQLSTLSLCNNSISTKGCQMISKANFTNLQQIHLRNNQIRDEGFIILASSPWTNPREVNLQNNKITNNISKLVKSDYNWWSDYPHFSSMSSYSTKVNLKNNNFIQLDKSDVLIYKKTCANVYIFYSWK